MRSLLEQRGGPTGWLSALLVPPLAALVLLPLRGTVDLASDALVMLLSVGAAALVGGLLPGLLAAVWATVLLNFLFTPPFHTFLIADPDDAVALLVFCLVAGLVSWAVYQSARRNDEALRAAAAEAADRVRAALLAAVGHDLRSPLATAKTSISGLLSDDVVLPTESRRELLEGADASLDRLTALVNDLLDLSRLQAGAVPVEVRPTALDEVVARALDHCRVDPGSVLVDVPDDLPEVYADPALLERVVANLLSNALRFSPSGRPPGVAAQVRDRNVDLRVADHGPGVSADDHEQIFRPFQRLGDTTHTEGLGLGLAVARSLVEAMDGELRPGRTPGGGLTMTVSLPAVT